jgi:cobalt/nickel transport system ATP-binding protein
MSHHLVIAEHAGYVYPDGTVALEDVNFRITHGESVALVGGNGAGKSTLLLLLSGCELATTGTIRVGDAIMTTATRPLLRQAVGMVFQNADDQLFMPTVYDDVAFGPRNQNLSPPEIEHRVEEALCRVGALELRERPPFRLSAGQKRAVAIATVLAMNPNVLVMDEPSSNLDPASRRRLLALLQGFEHTRIIATHDLDLAFDVCRRTIVLHAGRVAADGPTAELLSDRALLHHCHLELPPRLQSCPRCNAAPS